MSEQENVQAIQSALAAFRRGDSQTFLSLLSEDVDFQHPMPNEIWPWAGKRRGKAEVAQAFAGLAATTEFELFEPREFIAQGDKVAVLVFERFRIKATNVSVDNSYVHVYTIKDGRIVQMLIFEDTAPIIRALNTKDSLS